MTDIQLEKAVEAEVVLRALEHLKKDEIMDVIACFDKKFQFSDRGIGLEFNNPRRLAELFRKTREFYPDSSLQMDRVVVSGEHVTAEWKLRFSFTEPFYGGQSLRVPIVLRGVSIVQTENGKITGWTDYYDGLTSRRTALAAHFEEWVEL